MGPRLCHAARSLCPRWYARSPRSHSEEGEVEILGVLRTSDRARNTFTPDNEPAEGKWYLADLGAMADHAGGLGGIAGVQPVFIEQIVIGKLLRSARQEAECSRVFRGPRR